MSLNSVHSKNVIILLHAFFILILGNLIMAQRPHPSIIEDGFIDANPPYAFSHTVSILEISPGVVLGAWVGGPANRDPQNAIWIARREAGKWGSAEKFASGDVAHFNPVFWMDAKSGEIVINYKRGTSPESWSGVIQRSSDGGKTWSAPEFLPAGLVGAVRSKPVWLLDGTLLCGDSVEAYQAWSGWVNVTKDNGRTWRRVGPITLPDTQWGVIQPVIFPMDDKGAKLRMLLRGSTPVGMVCDSVSTDGGMSWSPARRVEALPNPNSAVDAIRLNDRRIILVHNDTETGKNRLAVSFSGDGGETWKKSFDLKNEAEGEYLYPYVMEDAAGMVHVAYTWKKQKLAYVVLDPKKIQ